MPQIIINIPDDEYKEIMNDKELNPRSLNHFERLIARGILLEKYNQEYEQAQWIPINEKLPGREDEGYLLLTFTNGGEGLGLFEEGHILDIYDCEQLDINTIDSWRKWPEKI